VFFILFLVESRWVPKIGSFEMMFLVWCQIWYFWIINWDYFYL